KRVNGFNLSTLSEPARHIRLVRGDDQQKACGPEIGERLRHSGKNFELVERKRREGLACFDHPAIDHAVAIEKDGAPQVAPRPLVASPKSTDACPGSTVASSKNASIVHRRSSSDPVALMAVRRWEPLSRPFVYQE